jgi:hypothetical protein
LLMMATHDTLNTFTFYLTISFECTQLNWNSLQFPPQNTTPTFLHNFWKPQANGEYYRHFSPTTCLWNAATLPPPPAYRLHQLHHAWTEAIGCYWPCAYETLMTGIQFIMHAYMPCWALFKITRLANIDYIVSYILADNIFRFDS